MNTPRAEHPNPQWERKNWRSLNGVWEFEFDFGCSAIERTLWKKEKFDKEIMVPFCPESKLSGPLFSFFYPYHTIFRSNCNHKNQTSSSRFFLSAATLASTCFL